jgi:hypothetical protein
MTASLADATSTDDTGTDDDIDQDATDVDDTATDVGDDDGSDALGDAGKRALDAMKAKWRTERARAKAAEDKLAAATKPNVDSDDIATVREQAKAEARAEGLRDRVLDKIEAKAAGRFKDPEDALLRLGKNVDDYISDGQIDLDSIEDALIELLEKRPDFGVTQGEPKRFKGTADSGPKASAGKPQLTEADLPKMTPEPIVEAQNAGQFDKLLGIS